MSRARQSDRLLGVVRCVRCQRRLPPSGECAFHGRPSTAVEVVEAIPDVAPPPGWQLGSLVACGGTAIVHTVRRDGLASAILKRARWRDNDLRARFAHEVAVLELLGAPIAPKLYAHGEVDGFSYLVMEHVPGEPLSTWMGRNGDRGGIGQILAILTRVADVVGQLHDHGVIHRDLKPENLLVGPSGVRVVDFGVAMMLGDAAAVTEIASVVGTPHYMAPEQLVVGSRIDRRADLYALGVIAFEMIAGVPPFVGDRRAVEYNHRVSRPPSLREFRDVPASLDELVASCLAKSPDARPRDAATIQAQLSKTFESLATLRGLGAGDRPLGRSELAALVWIDGGDPVAVVRAVTDVQGLVVRRAGDGIVAAFASMHHDAPVAAALALCNEIAGAHARIVLHAATVLVRRTPNGKVAVYGDDVERLDAWLPQLPFRGVVATYAAAPRLRGGAVVAATDVAGAFRVAGDDSHPARDAHLVGRERVVDAIVAAVASPRHLVCVAGAVGLGKSRVVAAVRARLRERGREVIALAGRRRFVGEAADDDRVISALGGGRDDTVGSAGGGVQQAIGAAGARGAVIVLDDVQLFSAAVRAAVVDPRRGATCIVTSPSPLFEPSDAGDRALFELAPLSDDVATALVRALLQPARLIPAVLVERIVGRAAGVPGVLVAIARGIVERGGLRRNAGGDDWYVAADELDTLLSARGDAPMAAHALGNVAPEVVRIAEAAAALGPRFVADEIAAATGGDPAAAVAVLVKAEVLGERAGWYEFGEAGVQDVLYAQLAAERGDVHERALAYWLRHSLANVTGWLARVAHHASGAGRRDMAVACWVALARLAHTRGDRETTAELLELLFGKVGRALPAELAEAVAALAGT